MDLFLTWLTSDMIISFTNTHANAHPASQVQHLEAMVQHLEEYLQTYPHQPEEKEKGEEDKDEAETDERKTRARAKKIPASFCWQSLHEGKRSSL